MTVSLLITVVNILFFYKKYHATYNIKCESFVRYYAIRDQFSYEVIITMDLRNDSMGSFGIEGVMRKGNHSWTLNRDVDFSYQHLQTNYIRLNKVHIIKHGRDNSPDDIFDRNFISLKDEASRTISLAKVMNGYVIGTLRAPVFTCLSR